jgi:hypothetical protein
MSLWTCEHHGVTGPQACVLPGNPGSDWTEQDARDVEHAMRFVEEFFGDKRCSLNAKYATALRREILRLRAENEYLAERVEAFEAQQSALLDSPSGTGSATLLRLRVHVPRKL